MFALVPVLSARHRVATAIMLLGSSHDASYHTQLHHQRQRRHVTSASRRLWITVMLLLTLHLLSSLDGVLASARLTSVWSACVAYNTPIRIATLAGTSQEITPAAARYAGMWSWLQ